ncbi:MAG TPA: tyrosine-type recombinase/integrase [Bryobacteraceae bacterium]|jgi:integrase
MAKKRRGNNEGCILEERSGRWVASISLGYRVVDGKRRRVRRKFVGPTRAAVQKRLTAALNKQQNGGKVPAGKLRFGAFFRSWLDTMIADEEIRDSTAASYRWLFEKHIEPEIGTERLANLDTTTIANLLRRKREQGLSQRTVQYIRAVISSALSQAVAEDRIGQNPALSVKRIKRSRKEKRSRDLRKHVKPLSIGEAGKFLSTARHDRLEALFTVALSCGLRRGEALGIRLVDLDLAKREITIVQAVQRVKGKGLIITETKNDDSDRTVPLPEFIIPILERHLERRERDCEFAADRWTERGLLFTNTIGGPLEPRNVLKRLHTLLKAAELPRFRFHDLRHTAASLLFAGGASEFEVQKILGHSQSRLTKDLYGHLYREVAHAAIGRVDKILAPPKPPKLAPQLAPSRRLVRVK